MRVRVNGTELWFDVDGAALVPVGARMRRRPTVLLVHGGPGSYDHSYLTPHFGRLAGEAQVVYLDLRGHVGRQDPVTPVEAAREIADHLDPRTARLAVLEDTGHFPWLDQPDRYWALLTAWLAGKGACR